MKLLAVLLTLFCIESCRGIPIEPCPPGFLKHQRSCYRFSRLNGTWTDARSYCDAMKAHLVSITYNGLQRFLTNHLVRSQASSNYWIGGNDLAVEGEWRWVYDNSALNYKAFANANTPDNKADGEHCLAMDSRQNFRWNDEPCDKRNYFICESHLIEDTRRKVI